MINKLEKYFTLISKFGAKTKINNNIVDTFLCFFIISQYMYIHNIEFKSGKRMYRYKDIKEQILDINKETNELLEYIDFKSIFDSLIKEQIINSYKFMYNIIDVKDIASKYCLGNIPYGVMANRSLHNKQIYDKNLEKKIYIYQEKLGILSFYNLESSLLLLNTEENELYYKIINSLLNTKIKKIYIISYNNSIFGQEDYTKIRNYSNNDNRVVFDNNPVKDFEYIEEYISRMEENTFLLIIGADRLIKYNKEEVTNTNYRYNSFNLNIKKSKKWKEFFVKINRLFSYSLMEKKAVTMVYNIYYDEKLMEDIKEDIKEHGESIGIYTMFYSTVKNKADELLNLLITKKRKEYSQKLIEYKGELGEDDYNILLGTDYLISNNYLKAEEHFLKLSTNTHLDNKLMLAQIYIAKEEYDKAYKILKDIYEQDKYLNDLMKAIIFVIYNMNDEKLFKEWIDKALLINKNDEYVLLYAANFYNFKKDFRESSKYWNLVYLITGDSEYKLLKEINIILSDIKKYNSNRIFEIMKEAIKDNQELMEWVYYRTGLMVNKYKQNNNESLNYLSKVNSQIGGDYAYEAAIERLRINKNILKKSKNSRINNQYKIIEEIVKDIPVITYEEKNNYRWSEYIQNTMPYEKWKNTIVNMIYEKLDYWIESSVKLIDKGKISINKDLDLEKRIVKVNNRSCFKEENEEEYLLLVLMSAIEAIKTGDIQMANNYAFTLFKYASTHKNNHYKNVSILFGLIIWSNSNYKIGDKVESIIALVAAIDLSIKIEEITYPLLFGFQNIIEFLCCNSDIINSNEKQMSALYKMYDSGNFYVDKNSIYFINKQYDKIIKNTSNSLLLLESLDMETANIKLIVNIKEDKEQDNFIDELRMRINAYYKKGLIAEASKCIKLYKDTIMLNNKDRRYIYYSIFYKWAIILLKNKDYEIAKEFLDMAIFDIDKLRLVFHKRERALVGKQANKIYKKYLEVICKERLDVSSKYILSLTGNNKLNSLLFNVIPRAIVEQKQFNEDTNIINEEIEEKYQRYNELHSSISNLSIDKHSRYIEEMEEFLVLKTYLEKNHPSFKSLPIYSCLTSSKSLEEFELIKNKLGEKELLYQVILVDDCLIHNIISKKEKKIIIEKINLYKYKNEMEKFSQDITKCDFKLEKEELYNKNIDICNNISEMLIKPIYSYLNNEKYNHLYFMPDLSLNYASMNYMRYKNKWITEIFDSIENIIDWNSIRGDEYKENAEKYSAYFFEKKDKLIKPIMDTIEEKKIELINENQNKSYIKIKDNIKVLILVGHGISDVNGFDYVGAKSIKKSKEENINLNDYLLIEGRIENVLILSCSSGTLINEYAERNDGVWSSLLEKKIDYILYCKWDVSIDYTNKILSKIIEYMKAGNIKLSEALIKAQREMKEKHAVLWAGLEVWKNKW